MAVYLGSTEIQKIYHGSNEVDAARIGATGIFSSAPPDLEATLTISAFAVGRDARIRAFITDLNGIRSITSATLTARDGQTRTLAFNRTDANTFTSETLTLRHARWVRGSLTVVFVDNTSGATHTVTENYVEITGRVTRVGSATNFGQPSAFSLLGLASHNGIVYMAARGSNNSDLYTLDTTTGNATKVGSSNKFGVNLNFIGGLASHNGILYLADTALYTVNTTTGIATRIGTGFGVNINAFGTASYNGNLYIIDRNSQVLYTVDVTTGTATRIGTGNSGQPQGLTEYNGELLATEGNALRIVDITTGRLTFVGGGYQGITNSASAITNHNGTIYLVDNSSLYTIS